MEGISYSMEELIPIVAKLAEQYTSYESTSVTYEKANQLMEAVIYCIREYERAPLDHLEEYDAEKTGISHGRMYLAAREGLSAKEAYRLGYQLVDAKVRAMKEKYHTLLLDFHSYGNIALKDTVAAVPEFLKWYDIKYDPQNTILTLDYPVLKDLGQYTGIDAVWEYVKCISIEQRFLNRFPETYVKRALSEYCEEYEEMFENLGGILLSDLVYHLLLKRPFDDPGRMKDDQVKVQAVLGMYSPGEAKEAVRGMVREFICKFYKNNMEIWHYLEKECDNIVVRICHTVTAS